MQLLDWKSIFLLMISLNCIQSHMLHYYKLQKFLTAVAFARALGKRPTILPIPIPIPIPIAQNEVIKIPIKNNAKTTILDGSKGSTQAIAIAHLLNGGTGFTGSSAYGYALPGVSSPSVINLSSLKGSDSNVVNLASAIGAGGNGGQTRIVVLGGQNSGNPLGSLNASPSIIQLSSLPAFNTAPGNNIISIRGLNYGNNVVDNGLNGMNIGLNGMNLGTNRIFHNGGINVGSAFSMNPSNIFQIPQNVYSDKSRRRIPFKFRGHNMQRSNDTGFNRHDLRGYSQKDKYHQSMCSNCHNNPHQSSQHVQAPTSQESYKKPIPVGERFSYRP